MSALFDGSAALFLQTNPGTDATYTGVSGATNVWSCWFRPTSLVSINSQTGIMGRNSLLLLSATTGQLRWRFYHTLGYGVYDSTDANLSTNTWYHVTIVFSSVNQTTSYDFQVWLATETSIPRKLTMSLAQSPSGVASFETDWFLGGGDVGSGINGFQGNISQALQLIADSGPTVLDYLINDQFVFTQFVYPIYLGTLDLETALCPGDGLARTNVWRNRWVPLDGSFTDASASQVRFPYFAGVNEQTTPRNFEFPVNRLTQVGTSSAVYSPLEPRSTRRMDIPVLDRRLPQAFSRV